MPNAPIDKFMHDLGWKALLAVVLSTIGVLCLREFLQWLDRRPIRAVRPLRKYKQDDQEQEQTAIDVMGDSVPRCPLCNGMMVKRTVRHGKNGGSTFWGCFGYPRCRGTKAI